MLTDELFIVVAPQFGGLTVVPPVPAGVLLVTVMIKQAGRDDHAQKAMWSVRKPED
jgi:hypothetical protein